MAPKVFVSHASEDKDRFVLAFAKRLREKGVDAWLDKWEMLPGDSLVDKIFEEGIKEASAVIVVLSNFSIQKPWVREELNAAFVKRINNGSKLIPVIIDDCEVPKSLKSTLWEKIGNLAAYDTNLDHIVASIFGTTDKPPIGSAPSYVKSFSVAIGQLNNIDSLVLRLSCEAALKTGNNFINPGKVFLVDDRPVVPELELADSLEMLDRGGYIKLSRTIGAGFSNFQLTTNGFDAYANACIPDYQSKISAVISAIVNKQLVDNASIEKELNQPRLLIDHILDVLENNRHLKQSKMVGGLCRIYNISPALKRALKGG